MANNKRGRGKRRRKVGQKSPRMGYGIQFTEKGRDVLAEVFAQFRDRPMYYVLGEDAELIPLGSSHLLSVEDRARWSAFKDDATARTLAETRISNPVHPHYPVFVHTTFTARDISFAYPLPNNAPVLWQTTLLENSIVEMEAAAQRAEAEGDDGSWLLEDVPDAALEEITLARKLGLSVDDFEDWIRVYATREEALQGHEETVRWVRRALGSY